MRFQASVPEMLIGRRELLLLTKSLIHGLLHTGVAQGSFNGFSEVIDLIDIE